MASFLHLLSNKIVNFPCHVTSECAGFGAPPPAPQAKPPIRFSTSFSCSFALLFSAIPLLFLSALRGIAIVGPFNKRFTRNSALRMTALGHCHRCRQLPACSTHLPAPFTCPAASLCHFLTSRGCFYCRESDSFVCHCRKLNFKLFSQLSLDLRHAYNRPRLSREQHAALD